MTGRNSLLQARQLMGLVAEVFRCEVPRVSLEGAWFVALEPGLVDLFERQAYRSDELLPALRSVLELSVSQSLPDDFLHQVYRYTLRFAFPESVRGETPADLVPAIRIFLEAFRFVCGEQALSKDGSWRSRYPLAFLTDEEEAQLEEASEYHNFLAAFRDEYVYEMMRLNQELLGYDTLNHICGVASIALHVSRQLKSLGYPIDLGRVCGSAIGHDLGKFGCRAEESHRVPYLHYYYSDMWFCRRNMPHIGHTAVNHSVWDIELENLPVESLILIYSDFRVKGKLFDDGQVRMHLYSLAESFSVILEKLDSLDEKKELRYRRVYAKLRDFEDFMINLGISTVPGLPAEKPEASLTPRLPDHEIMADYLDVVSAEDAYRFGLDGQGSGVVGAALSPMDWQKKYFALLSGSGTVQSFKYMAISHNINVLYQLRDESSLNSLLDVARGDDKKHLRQYLHMLLEYSAHFTQKQKLVTLRFLFEHLTDPEDDIRSLGAWLMGMIIADFDEDYRKELPADVVLPPPPLTAANLLGQYMNEILHPDYKMLPTLQDRIVESLPAMMKGLFQTALPEDWSVCIDWLHHFCLDESLTVNAQLSLVESLHHLPGPDLDEALLRFQDFLGRCCCSESAELRLTAQDSLLALVDSTSQRGPLPEVLRRLVTGSIECENTAEPSLAEAHLLCQLTRQVSDEGVVCPSLLSAEQQSDIFLDNLKTAVFWGAKRVQIRMLIDGLAYSQGENDFYIAMHLCNLLKVSASEKVRNQAGESLIALFPRLSSEKKNDVIVELVRALQLDGPQFTEYVPAYLGRALLLIPPRELDEVLDDFRDSLKSTGASVGSLILKTLGITLQNYGDYSRRQGEGEESSAARRTRIVGLLLSGLVHYDPVMKETAFGVIGIDLFGSRRLSLEEKAWIFARISKKLLTLISEPVNEELFFLTNSASLNRIYRFIGEYSFLHGTIPVCRPSRIAFFPGAFDPFSISHKDIVRAIRDLDFEVFLAVDEFSWSKSTMAHRIRKNIINMSIADELHVYLFPSEFQVNIANDKDLALLEGLFGDVPRYLVVGSDVLSNASAYRNEEKRIRQENHVVFDRKVSLHSELDERAEEVLRHIEGDVIRLTLPSASEDVSSTQIRSNIDGNLDISSLVEGNAQNYIYKHGFYKSEPRFKATQSALKMTIDCRNRLTEEERHELLPFLQLPDHEARSLLESQRELPEARYLRIRDLQSGKIIAFSMFHRLDSHRAYDELQNAEFTYFLRKHSTGKIQCIDGLYTDPHARSGEMGQILLTETLGYGLARDYEFAFVLPRDGVEPASDVDEALTMMSFLPVAEESVPYACYVSMTRPNTIIMDLKANLKEPWRNNPAFLEVLKKSRRDLLRSICALTPGQLVLVFSRSMLLQSLIRKVCEANGVPTESLVPRQQGRAMCVPFGDIMKKTMAPNTVTKSLHTEKCYSPDMWVYSITSSPMHLDLKTQIRMLRSFDRPVLLVDDLLDRGFRLETLLPLFKKAGTPVEKIIVGIISARGRELIQQLGYDLDSVYYLPRISIWLNEKYFYPFLGGYSIQRPHQAEWHAIPSINHVLPFCYPDYMERYDKERFYDLSKTAMDNARALLTVLESEYRNIHEKSLSLSTLGQVIWTPRYPDQGIDMLYNPNLVPSHYLQNSEELLKRLGPIRL